MDHFSSAGFFLLDVCKKSRRNHSTHKTFCCKIQKMRTKSRKIAQSCIFLKIHREIRAKKILHEKRMQKLRTFSKIPFCGVIILIHANRKNWILLISLFGFVNFAAILLLSKIFAKFCYFLELYGVRGWAKFFAFIFLSTVVSTKNRKFHDGEPTKSIKFIQIIA